MAGSWTEGRGRGLSDVLVIVRKFCSTFFSVRDEDPLLNADTSLSKTGLPFYYLRSVHTSRPLSYSNNPSLWPINAESRLL